MTANREAAAEGRRPTTKFDFGGPWGAAGLTLALPAIVYYLALCIGNNGGAFILPRSREEWLALASSIPAPTLKAAVIYAAWFSFQALLQIYAPGKWIKGTPLRDGSRLEYKMNGWVSWWLTWACLFAAVKLGAFKATLFADNYGPLLSTVVLWSFIYSGWLYWWGKRHGAGERTYGNVFHDYFMGTALNPRTGRFDHKLFCEARPGLILWVAGNLSFAARQYEATGTITTPMILVCAFHFFYIADYYFHEEAILTTWDIKHENFGFMLCFGDLAWVPFTYTYQAYYLVTHTHDLPLWGAAAIVVLNMTGYYFFRSVNLQKHRFRTDPTRPIWGRPPEYIKTARGSLLLLSGWWGVARHLNYLGDLMMGLAWCLPCLFDHLTPYFYIIYFTCLLIHRERRDNEMCAERYGADWEEYRKRVRWRILPGIY